jgi:hypothetical protein
MGGGGGEKISYQIPTNQMENSSKPLEPNAQNVGVRGQ